ncbi:ATP-dependent DNA helicase chl1 [Coemansia sp. RSA 455]|nr:ATP-dependent DNA helicase chl1 [Coemansia sp. RSA 455]
MASRRAAPTDVSKKHKPDMDSSDSDDEMMVIEAYYSDYEEDAQLKSGSKLDDDGKVQYSTAVRKLLERRAGNRPLYDSSDNDNSNNNDSSDSAVPLKEPSVTKIIYTLKTHSQLQQFVNEIKHTHFASKNRMLTAGSKKNARCGYLPLRHTPTLDFKDVTGSVIMDIEELTKESRRRCTCPYYGARASINGAQVVVLPYNTLLSRSVRQAMGISLTGNVVIIDEAPNLVDTILAIHSIALDWRTIRGLLEMAQMYFTKYWRRLKGSNVTYIRQTITLLKALNKFMQSTTTDSNTRVVSVNEFLTLAHVDHINVY